jgi:hypothetical protein
VCNSDSALEHVANLPMANVFIPSGLGLGLLSQPMESLGIDRRDHQARNLS